MRKMLILLALVVVTTANIGGCTRHRRWLHRGSPCGTNIVAQPAMCAPAAIGVPVAAPQVAPVVAPAPAPAPIQQVIVPQPIYCCPQPEPCCPPCPIDPCQSGMMPGMTGGYLQGGIMAPCDCGAGTTFDEGYLVHGTETPLDSDSQNADPGPAREN